MSTWEDDDEIEQAEVDFGRSGVRVLLYLTRELTRVSSDSGALSYGSTVLAKMEKIEKATHAYTYRRTWKICIRQTDRIGQGAGGFRSQGGGAPKHIVFARGGSAPPSCRGT